MSISQRRLAMMAVLIPTGVAWGLWRPTWPNATRDWLAQEIPWLARLFETWQALVVFVFWWLVLREPRCHPGVLVLWGLYTVLTLLELSMGWFLGGSLALLAAVALVARPWPNRAIMARCAALAAFAVGVDAIAR